ncbi:hypothetical protein FHX09_001405 [Rhizobium sp. BK538]|nr:hypothetical protein [Rhizobium sp. BK060]MBB4167574.1 hypothetical protein [Rhizobium sp. BK538]TCM78423.1 Na+/H+ antiporter 1 [Rhizobium sp. BK068]
MSSTCSKGRIRPLSVSSSTLVGVPGTVAVLVELGRADLPAKASWGQMTGVALLCGIGLTMSLFIGLLAFSDPSVQDHVKIGILMGSVVSTVLRAVFLRWGISPVFLQTAPAIARVGRRLNTPKHQHSNGNPEQRTHFCRHQVANRAITH